MEKDKVQSNDEISNKDLKRVEVEPAALSDADLENVAGGMWVHSGTLALTNIGIGADSATAKYTVK